MDSAAETALPLPAPQAVLRAWRQRVRANGEQVERLRETPAPESAAAAAEADFYQPVATRFRADPHRTGDPVLEVLRGLAPGAASWLDVGTGAGRYALPLGLLPGVREVIALDPSASMLEVLRQSADQVGSRTVRAVQARWPAPELGLEADVALICHVGYDVAEIGPFLDALEGAARRLCVAVLFQQPAPALFDALWPDVHGEPRAALPALTDFLLLLLARQQLFEVRLLDVPGATYSGVDDALQAARQQLWTQPHSLKDFRLRQALQRRLLERHGRFALSWAPRRLGVVTWQPPPRPPA